MCESIKLRLPREPKLGDIFMAREDKPYKLSKNNGYQEHKIIFHKKVDDVLYFKEVNSDKEYKYL